jgi:hypothetical protein
MTQLKELNTEQAVAKIAEYRRAGITDSLELNLADGVSVKVIDAALAHAGIPGQTVKKTGDGAVSTLVKDVKMLLKQDKKKSKAKKGADNTGGPGVIRTGADVDALRNPPRSAEVDAFLAETTNDPTVKNALKVLRDPNASPEAKRIAAVLVKQGLVQAGLHGEDLLGMPPAHDASDVNAVAGDLAKMRQEAEDCTDPVEKEQLSSKYTLEALRTLHRRGQRERAVKAAELAADDTPEIARLRELSKSTKLSEGLRMQVGEVLTRHDLAKSAASESQDRTNALVQQTLANAQANAQSATGADSSGQVGRIGSGSGTPESLGTPQNVGTSKPGYITGKEKELAKATNSLERARLGEELTLARLRASH